MGAAGKCSAAVIRDGSPCGLATGTRCNVSDAEEDIDPAYPRVSGGLAPGPWLSDLRDRGKQAGSSESLDELIHDRPGTGERPLEDIG